MTVFNFRLAVYSFTENVPNGEKTKYLIEINCFVNCDDMNAQRAFFYRIFNS